MDKPNIVLILADDMGYGDLSCLNDESKIHTKHMDAMAATGMTFTDAHASTSVCTPSRYGILTGRYAWRGRLQRGVLGPLDPPLIEADLLTWPQFLQDNGYHTACVGKWHLGMDWHFRSGRPGQWLPWHGEDAATLAADVDYSQPAGGGPVDRGFDYYFGVDVPNFPPYCFMEHDRTVGIPDRDKPEEMFGTPGPMVDGWRLEDILPALAERACSYIERQAKANRPFFLYMPLTAPHTPLAPTEEFIGASGAGIYGDFVTQVDHTVGLVNAALRRAGCEDNTLVIVTSDNGSPGRDGNSERPGTVLERFGHNPSWILRGMKGDTWDAGHRSPFIAKWPARIAPDSACDALICLMDLFATSAAILETDVPDAAAQDSLNVLPYLRGETPGDPIRREIVHHGCNGLYGVRAGDWKLILDTGSGGFSPPAPTTPGDPPMQLYNMREDISERHNRFRSRPDKARELMEAYARIRCDVPPADEPAASWPLSE